MVVPASLRRFAVPVARWRPNELPWFSLVAFPIDDLAGAADGDRRAGCGVRERRVAFAAREKHLGVHAWVGGALPAEQMSAGEDHAFRATAEPVIASCAAHFGGHNRVPSAAIVSGASDAARSHSLKSATAERHSSWSIIGFLPSGWWVQGFAGIAGGGWFTVGAVVAPLRGV